MEPITGGALLAIGGITSLVSSALQAGNTRDAAKAIEDAVAKYGPEARDIIAQNLGGESALSQIYGEKLAPEAAAAQRNVLQRLQQISETGYTPQEEAALRRIQAETAATAASQRAATQEAFARRGISGGGAERVAAFQGAQAAANRASQQGLDVAAQAQRRALEALQSQGQFGQAFRGQAFNEAQTRAAADEQRRINRARMGLDVAGTEAGMKTGTAPTVAGLENKPLQDLGQTGSVLAQGGAGLWSKKEK